MILHVDILDIILDYTISCKVTDFVKRLTDFKTKTREVCFMDFDDVTCFRMFSYRRHKKSRLMNYTLWRSKRQII